MIKELTIKRSEWLRGDKQNSKLLDEKGRKCCLGFFCLADGAKPEQILNFLSPKSAGFKSKQLVEFDDARKYTNSHFGYEAMVINDDTFTTEKKREELLTEWFATNGVKISFID